MEAKLFFVGLLTGLLIITLLRVSFTRPTDSEKEVSIKEYIQHPENFKVYHLKDDTLTVDIKVEYLK